MLATLRENAPLGPINGRVIVTYHEKGCAKRMEVSVLGRVRGVISARPDNVLLVSGMRTRERQIVVIRSAIKNHEIKDIQTSKALKGVIDVEVVDRTSETILFIGLKTNMVLKGPTPTDRIEGTIRIW